MVNLMNTKEYTNAKYSIDSGKIFEFLNYINIPFHNGDLSFWAKRQNNFELNLRYGNFESSYSFDIYDGEKNIVSFDNESLESSLKQLLNGNFLFKNNFSEREKKFYSPSTVNIELIPTTTQSFADKERSYQPFFNKILNVLQQQNFTIEGFHIHLNMGNMHFFVNESLETSLITEEKRLKELKHLKDIYKNDPKYEQYANLYTKDKLQKLEELFNNLRTNFELKE